MFKKCVLLTRTLLIFAHNIVSRAILMDYQHLKQSVNQGISVVHKKIGEIENQTKKLDQEHADVQNRMVRLTEMQQTTVLRSISTKKDELRGLTRFIEKARFEVSKLSAEFNEYGRQNEEKKSFLMELKPICENLKKIQIDHEREIEILIDEVKDLDQQKFQRHNFLKALTSDVEQLKNAKGNLAKQIQEKENELAKMESKLNQEDKEINQIREEMNSLSDRIKVMSTEQEELIKETNQLNIEISSLQEQVFNKDATYQKDLQDWKARKREQFENYLRIINNLKIDDFSAKVQETQDKLDDLRQSLVDNQEKEEEMKQESEKLQKSINLQKKNLKQQLDKEKKLFKKLEQDRCMVKQEKAIVEQQLEHILKEKQQLNTETEAFESKTSEVIEKLKEMSEKLRIATKDLKEKKRKCLQLQMANDELSWTQDQDEVEDLENQIEMLKKQTLKYQSLIQAEQKLQERIRSEIANLIPEIEEVTLDDRIKQYTLEKEREFESKKIRIVEEINGHHQKLEKQLKEEFLSVKSKFEDEVKSLTETLSRLKLRPTLKQTEKKKHTLKDPDAIPESPNKPEEKPPKPIAKKATKQKMTIQRKRRASSSNQAQKRRKITPKTKKTKSPNVPRTRRPQRKRKLQSNSPENQGPAQNVEDFSIFEF